MCVHEDDDSIRKRYQNGATVRILFTNTDGVCDMTGLACIQHHMQQADGLCGTTLQLQSQYEWKFYARWHGHETVGKDSKAVRPSNI